MVKFRRIHPIAIASEPHFSRKAGADRQGASCGGSRTSGARWHEAGASLAQAVWVVFGWRTGQGTYMTTQKRPATAAFVLFGGERGGIVRGRTGWLRYDAAPLHLEETARGGLHVVHGVVGAVEGAIE